MDLPDGTNSGFTMMPNEMRDALYQIRIPGEARMVFDAIFAKTFGFRDSVTKKQIKMAVLKPEYLSILTRI